MLRNSEGIQCKNCNTKHVEVRAKSVMQKLCQKCDVEAVKIPRENCNTKPVEVRARIVGSGKCLVLSAHGDE